MTLVFLQWYVPKVGTCLFGSLPCMAPFNSFSDAVTHATSVAMLLKRFLPFVCDLGDLAPCGTSHHMTLQRRWNYYFTVVIKLNDVYSRPMKIMDGVAFRFGGVLY